MSRLSKFIHVNEIRHQKFVKGWKRIVSFVRIYIDHDYVINFSQFSFSQSNMTPFKVLMSMVPLVFMRQSEAYLESVKQLGKSNYHFQCICFSGNILFHKFWLTSEYNSDNCMTILSYLSFKKWTVVFKLCALY